MQEQRGVVYVYAMFDRKMKEFGAVATARNDDTIKRQLSTQLKGSGSMMEKYPDDFDVFRIGMFDPETGELARVPAQMVCNLVELLPADVPSNKEA